jgi:hypothetical protein
MRFSERVYGLLLKAYPRHYRRRFEGPMLQLFGDQLRAANTWGKLARLWVRTLADFLVTLPGRYLEPSPRGHGFENWTAAARHSVLSAREQASSFYCREITPEHLLLGILREDPELLPDLAAATTDFVLAIEAAETAPRRTPPMEDLRVSFTVCNIFELAKEEAALSNAQNLKPRHLLAAILRREDTLAAQLLRGHGIDLDWLRRTE